MVSKDFGSARNVMGNNKNFDYGFYLYKNITMLKIEKIIKENPDLEIINVGKVNDSIGSKKLQENFNNEISILFEKKLYGGNIFKKKN